MLSDPQSVRFNIFSIGKNSRKSFLFTFRITNLRSAPGDLATLHWLQIGKSRKKCSKIVFPGNLYRKVYSNAISCSYYAVGRLS